ncbi:MAG: SDR family oxidoreductase, partial [Sphingomonas sp.]
MTQGTALVTGASAGLGTHFARALAAEGHDLILTARRADRLEVLAAEIRAAHAVRVETIAADLAAPGAAAALMAEIGKRGLAVNTLINNAGFGLAGAFVEQDPGQIGRMIELNCGALVDLCRAVLPGMVQMRSGGILNVASTAAFQPGPFMAVYYASKAFVLSFSEALHEEVRGQGVRVAALCPGPTQTEFFDAAAMGDDILLTPLRGAAGKGRRRRAEGAARQPCGRGLRAAQCDHGGVGPLHPAPGDPARRRLDPARAASLTLRAAQAPPISAAGRDT